MAPKNDHVKIAFIGLKGIPAKWGGIEVYVEELGRRLVERGHDVTVFGSRWFCESGEMKDYNGIHVRPLRSLHFRTTDAFSNAFLATIVVAIEDFDVVSFHGYASYLFVPFVRRLGKITMVTTHGVESGWNNPKYGFFVRGTIRQAFKIGIRQADVVTTVANHLKERINAFFKVDAHLLPSGIPDVNIKPAQIIRQRYGLNGLDYLLFLGRIDPIKRVEWILDLAKNLKGVVKIVIAGGAQDCSTKAYMQNLVRRAGNSLHVIFTGPVFGSVKAELLSNCLIFLAPSKNEGYPITLLEAVAYGRCCVASDIPAHKEIIRDGITGFLFHTSEKKQFIDLAEKLISKQKNFVESIGSKARNTVVEELTWKNTADRFEHLIKRLVHDKREKK